MPKTILLRNQVDIVSKIRRAERPESLAHMIGIILNDDGSVFDRLTKTQSTSVVEWSRKYRDEVQ